MASSTGIENIYSLKDIAALKNPNGTLADVAEVMMKSNTMIGDMPFREGNLETGDRITVRKSLGSPKWKGYNEWVKASVSRTSQVDEVTGHLEDWSQIDCDLADKAGANIGNFLMREAKPKMQAMADEMVSQMIYGSLGDNPKTFNGFMYRLNTLNDQYMNGEPIVLNAGGTDASQNASILLVGWGDSSVYGIYPKGSQAGLQFEDKGRITSEKDGGFLDVYRSKFSWDAGLAVKDYRNILRIANIDVGALKNLNVENAKNSPLYNVFMNAVGLIPNPQAVNLVAYAPRAVWIALSQIANAYGNRADNMNVAQGGFVANIFGVPVKVQDSMLTTEAVVSA